MLILRCCVDSLVEVGGLHTGDKDTTNSTHSKNNYYRNHAVFNRSTIQEVPFIVLNFLYYIILIMEALKMKEISISLGSSKKSPKQSRKIDIAV